MSSPRRPGDGRGARRNGLTGTARPDGRRGPGDKSKGTAGRGRGPGEKRITRGPGPTRATGRPRAQRWTARLTGRAILLAGVVVLLVISLAYPLQSYLAQQADIAGLQAENTAAQLRVEELRMQVERLDDPGFIQTQAQSRLHYVMPGDRLYVIDDSGQALALPGQVAAEPDEAEIPWFQRVFDSIVAADASG